MTTCNQMQKIRTGSGRLVDPFNIVRGDIQPYYVLRALSHINRFTGHGKWPYSVGQHTLILVEHVPAHLKRAALVHDWQESLFNDLASPIKNNPELYAYKRAEHVAGETIAQWMDVPLGHLAELDGYDKRLYADERDALFETIDDLGRGDNLVPLGVHPLWFQERPWGDVFDDLLLKYEQLFPERFT